MPGKKPIKKQMKDLAQHPVVLRVTDDTNPELLERRQYSPPFCKAFSQKFTILKETDQFKFTVDKEAQKQLPNIIENSVQKIEGLKTADVARQHRLVVLPVVAIAQFDHQAAGAPEKLFPVGVGRQGRAVAGQAQTEGLGQAVH